MRLRLLSRLARCLFRLIFKSSFPLSGYGFRSVEFSSFSVLNDVMCYVSILLSNSFPFRLHVLYNPLRGMVFQHFQSNTVEP